MAQQGSEIPACTERASTLVWQVRKDRSKRAVNLRFRKGEVSGSPLKPVQVRIVRRRATRAFEWRELNREHYAYRRRGRARASLTARYVENRSDYQALGSPQDGPDLPGLLPVPMLPTMITVPGLPTLPSLNLPIIPLVTGPMGGGGGEFKSDYCVRTLTRTVR